MTIFFFWRGPSGKNNQQQGSRTRCLVCRGSLIPYTFTQHINHPLHSTRRSNDRPNIGLLLIINFRLIVFCMSHMVLLKHKRYIFKCLFMLLLDFYNNSIVLSALFCQDIGSLNKFTFFLISVNCPTATIERLKPCPKG